MKNSTLVAIIILCSLLAGGSSGPVQKDAVISAFLESPEIIHAVAEASKGGFEPGDIRTVPYGSLCGAVGCQSSVLVIQSLVRRETNPITQSLMGLVYMGTDKKISRVERVVLVPFAEVADEN
jgi:hypothetical protein